MKAVHTPQLMGTLSTTVTIISVTKGENIKIIKKEEMEDIHSIPLNVSFILIQVTFDVYKRNDRYKA